eukprot:GHRR01003404.1.p1 GENE.GHRR01003404.1~~GHRR01003404.1.p1  ORF type:complete len:405 (+),score=101.52 GHRR01003404.1:151-1365(+)
MASSSASCQVHPAAPTRFRVTAPWARPRRAITVLARSQQVDKGFSLLEWTSKLVPQGALVTGAKTGWRLAWQAMVRELAPQDQTGNYSRPKYAFDEQIGTPQFPAASGRYHVYVGNACPWCHRVLLVMATTGLDKHITVGRLADIPEKATRGGWVFNTPDPVTGASDLWEVYDKMSPGFRGRCTAPLLIDKQTMRPVSNESSSIMRMLGKLQLSGCLGVDLYPQHLQQQIDQLNDQVYRAINNGVYRAGFSTSQAGYDAAVGEMHQLMARLDQQLTNQRFLLGDRCTEADLRLFPTICRFDAVYAGIFKCGKRRVADYPHLQAWMRDVWQIKTPGSGMQVSDTVDIDGCRVSYYTNLFPLNPGGIIPSGPTAADLQLDKPADRGSSRVDDIFYLQQTATALLSR